MHADRPRPARQGQPRDIPLLSNGWTSTYPHRQVGNHCPLRLIASWRSHGIAAVGAAFTKTDSGLFLFLKKLFRPNATLSFEGIGNFFEDEIAVVRRAQALAAEIPQNEDVKATLQSLKSNSTFYGVNLADVIEVRDKRRHKAGGSESNGDMIAKTKSPRATKKSDIVVRYQPRASFNSLLIQSGWPRLIDPYALCPRTRISLRRGRRPPVSTLSPSSPLACRRDVERH